MRLDEYFENARGVGVLSTSDAGGKVNAAIYGRPHFMDDRTCLLYTSPSPRDRTRSRMPSSA